MDDHSPDPQARVDYQELDSFPAAEGDFEVRWVHDQVSGHAGFQVIDHGAPAA